MTEVGCTMIPVHARLYRRTRANTGRERNGLYIIISEISEYIELAKKRRVGLTMRKKKASERRTLPLVGSASEEQTMVSLSVLLCKGVELFRGVSQCARC